MPTERPIAYTRDNILAILAGRKRMTRRIVSPMPPTKAAVHALAGTGYSWYRVPETTPTATFRVAGPVWAVRQLMGCEPELRSPFGVAGDLLWVREGWRTVKMYDEMNGTQLGKHFGQPMLDCPIVYEADGAMNRSAPPVNTPGRLRAARFMPRWASRIDQTLTHTRIEPLDDITIEDAKAEGVGTRLEFMELWQEINGARPGCDWAANPWVWVLETGTL